MSNGDFKVLQASPVNFDADSGNFLDVVAKSSIWFIKEKSMKWGPC